MVHRPKVGRRMRLMWLKGECSHESSHNTLWSPCYNGYRMASTTVMYQRRAIKLVYAHATAHFVPHDSSAAAAAACSMHAKCRFRAGRFCWHFELQLSTAARKTRPARQV
ncbi:unnamed protein product [Ectocarpus sp. 12 AP-2014]